MEKVQLLMVTKQAWIPGNIMEIPLPWAMILPRRKSARLWWRMWKVGKMQRYRKGNMDLMLRQCSNFWDGALSFLFPPNSLKNSTSTSPKNYSIHNPHPAFHIFQPLPNIRPQIFHLRIVILQPVAPKLPSHTSFSSVTTPISNIYYLHG